MDDPAGPERKQIGREAAEVRRSAKAVERSTSELSDSADRRTVLAGDRTLLAAERTDADVCSFLFWSRMPLVIDVDGKAFLSDQRFPALRRTTFMVPLDKR